MSTRFARVVGETSGGFDSLYVHEAVKLLQREHAAVVRRVRRMEAIAQHITATRADELISRNDLLTWLKERGR